MATKPTAARPMKALTPCVVAAELEVVAGAEAEVLDEAEEVGVVPVPVLEAAPLALPVLDEVPLAVTVPIVLEAVAERVKETPLKNKRNILSICI